MTTELVINAKLSAMVKQLLEKGFRSPEVSFTINADSHCYIYINWRKPGETFNAYSPGCTQHFTGADFSESLLKTDEWVSAQPTIEQRQFREFAEILAKAVEVGKQNGIDAVLVNPLEKAMKDLSKNALMFQPEAA